jgi:hypothetical protein
MVCFFLLLGLTSLQWSLKWLHLLGRGPVGIRELSMVRGWVDGWMRGGGGSIRYRVLGIGYRVLECFAFWLCHVPYPRNPKPETLPLKPETYDL